MKNEYFFSLEQEPHGAKAPLKETIDKLAFNDHGLIPVITQDSKSQDVLMLAWMNKESIERTLATQKMTYWSRSRQQYWVKGETSGHTQKLVSMSFDCDGDTILCQVEQSGAACHTGRPNCFYLDVDSSDNSVRVVGDAPQ